MVSGGLFTQIGMLIVSVAIIFTYVKPEFTKISEVQDVIASYRDQRTTVISVNSLLSSYVNKIDSRSSDDQNRLNTYVPETVDSISVLRDLYLITKAAGVFYIDSSYVEEEEQSKGGMQVDETDNSTKVPLAHPIALSVEGNYDQIKVMLDLLEHNHYPLQITKMDITATDGEYLRADLELNTYSYRKFVIEDNNI